MNPIFSNKKLIGWVLGGIVTLLLITFSLTVGSNIVSQGVNDVTNILGRMLAYPANSVNDFMESISNLTNTYQENQTLKQKVETIYELEVQLNDLKKDNEKMKEALKLQDTLNDYTLINATVIARNPDTWRDIVTINKGANDGLIIVIPLISLFYLVLLFVLLVVYLLFFEMIFVLYCKLMILIIRLIIRLQILKFLYFFS